MATNVKLPKRVRTVRITNAKGIVVEYDYYGRGKGAVRLPPLAFHLNGWILSRLRKKLVLRMLPMFSPRCLLDSSKYRVHNVETSDKS
jgi:hypothetical protein